MPSTSTASRSPERRADVGDAGQGLGSAGPWPYTPEGSPSSRPRSASDTVVGRPAQRKSERQVNNLGHWLILGVPLAAACLRLSCGLIGVGMHRGISVPEFPPETVFAEPRPIHGGVTISGANPPGLVPQQEGEAAQPVTEE